MYLLLMLRRFVLCTGNCVYLFICSEYITYPALAIVVLSSTIIVGIHFSLLMVCIRCNVVGIQILEYTL